MTAHHWHGQTFWLTTDRILFWEEEKTLIASDLHIGKTGHFRKHGIAVPQDVYKEDLQRLFTSIQYFKAKRLLVVGDLFHSHANKELDWFVRWRNDFSSVDFTLIKGNHDILPQKWYETNAINIIPCLHQNGLLFVHDSEDCAAQNIDPASIKCTISGHLHPGVVIKAGPRQHITLPCFYFNHVTCILPAYSHFTGTYNIKPKKDDVVYVIAGKELMKL
jgi:DNA ligase-associated metallophosphoesterase